MYPLCQSGAQQTYRSTKRPYVYSACPLNVQHHFWSPVDRRADYMLPIVRGYIFWYRIPKVTKLKIVKVGILGMAVSEDIIWFDVCRLWLVVHESQHLMRAMILNKPVCTRFPACSTTRPSRTVLIARLMSRLLSFRSQDSL